MLRSREREVDVLEQAQRGRDAALEAYKQQISSLSAELRSLVDERQRSEPFQRCSYMDRDTDLQTGSLLFGVDMSLSELSTDAQERMAAAGLYFSMESVRAFLGGMAMSHLHILQGISGTGKTSFPKAFADAIGARWNVVEVQAGWRDRQDILGYFNPFEHRFHEEKLTEYLYEANTPKYLEAPYFVVLDEMNLSHPEQYFADVLSQLEQAPLNDRWLRLMDHADPAAAKNLRSGAELRIPPNVWFIGTANHDETTVSFAPKTRDRAHVFELPERHPDPRPGREPVERPSLPLRLFTRRFGDAFSRHAKAAEAALDFLEAIAPRLRGELRTGWGNRIVDHMRRYVPVVVGAGGTVREALDVFVTFKILYRLENRYEFTAKQLVGLRDDVLAAWEEVPGGEDPRRISGVLDREIKRLGN
jgi:hypothetical protein